MRPSTLLKEQRTDRIEVLGRLCRCQVEDFKTEGFVAAPSWPYQVNLLVADKRSYCQHIPQEGTTGWADTTMMAANAPHPNCAYMWLEHSLDPKVQGDVAAWFGSNPAVPAGCTSSDLLGADGLQDQRLQRFRQDRLLEDADRRLRQWPEQLRDLRQVG